MSTKSWLPLFFLATALALASCGGGGGDEPPPGTDDSDPNPGSDSNGDGDDPAVTFSIGGSVAGLTGTGLVVSNNGRDELTIDASGAFTFSDELADGEDYAVEVVAQPSNPDGVCTVADNPQYGFDADGNGLLVWTELDGFNDSARIRTIHTITGSAAIEEQTDSVASPAEMAINADGNAAAVWVQYDGADANVWVNLYEAGSGWGTARIIDEVDHPVEAADVAIDRDGNVMAVWQQTDGNPGSDVWARRYTAANGWNEASLEISDTPNYALRPKPAFDADGNALVIWAQDFGLDRGIYASRFTVAGGFEPPELIKSAEVGQTVEGQQIAIAPDGSALAVWEHPVNDGGSVTISVFASRFTEADRWDTPVVISHGDSFYPKIAIDGSGHALAVWQELDLSLPIGQGYAVWANRYTAGSGWTTAEQVGAHGTQIGTFMPNLAVDPVTGDGLTIWTRGGEVWVNTFTSTETLQ